ncbi:hypothetical protein BDP27DRAFT_407695 [Rhodocollybia butyracea]|uniref:Uncharacterized protein n=1 Tax=Rhodocollybia butyracea TaxID=206335 RepID=A0A9P5P803_9AGAR|nr:hypothetical protein BDP27DRAFT_407695 [Rhodocollybia butyracea]
MTGVGGAGGYMTALNVTARSFPDSLRGSDLGLVVSGFGLSAFLFSFIAQPRFLDKNIVSAIDSGTGFHPLANPRLRKSMM